MPPVAGPVSHPARPQQPGRQRACLHCHSPQGCPARSPPGTPTARRSRRRTRT